MPDKYRIVFLGTPSFAATVLEALGQAAQVVLVVTQPDRRVGRGRKVESPPVKVVADRLGLSTIQPEVVKGRRFAARIAEHQPDLLVTAAYGKLLGKSLLALPRLDALNVHASLLPRHRGAAPINRAILEGDQETGVSIMRMEQGLDAGPVFHVQSTPIGPAETAGQLTERLAELGAQALLHVLANYEHLEPTTQEHELATWAPMLRKADGLIDWRKEAPQLERHVRGVHPWPCASTSLEGRQLKVHTASVVDPAGQPAPPGTVIAASRSGIHVACGSGVLRLQELQAPGRARLQAEQFLAGNPVPVGVVLGQ